MTRAVLDSSTRVSAFLTPGRAADQVLSAVEAGAVVLCLSREILAETARVLLREPKLQARYRYDEAKVHAFCDGLAAAAVSRTSLNELRNRRSLTAAPALTASAGQPRGRSPRRNDGPTASMP